MAEATCTCAFRAGIALMCREHYVILEEELVRDPNVVNALLALARRVSESHIVRGEN